MQRLKQRADYLAAAAGRKAPGAAFILQARPRGDTAPARFGFTVSRKVGNAVERNRVRRRLREVVRRVACSGEMDTGSEQSAALPQLAGHDYVLIGRRAALALPFERMTAEFAGALKRVHGKPRARPAPESTT
jgi:ribonuclease P protein component